MKLGILMPHRLAASRVAEFAKAVERHGYEELWIPENISFVGGVAAAGIALASTTRIRLGLGVLPVSVRHPYVSAMEIGTLAGAYPGRFVAGFGSGVSSWLAPLGVQPASPLGAVRDTIDVVDRLLAGQQVTHSSEQFALQDMSLAASVQNHPPLMLAATGPRMMAAARRYAQGAVLSVLSSPQFVSAARQQLARMFPVDPEFEFVTFVNAFVGETTVEALNALRADTEFILNTMGAGPLTEAVGITAEHFEAWRSGGASVPDEWIARTSIAGTQQDCRARLEAYADAGVTTLVLSPKPAEHAMDMLERLARSLGV